MLHKLLKKGNKKLSLPFYINIILLIAFTLLQYVK